MKRRDLLKRGLGLGALGALAGVGLLPAQVAFAARSQENAFKAGKFEETIKALGAQSMEPSTQIVLGAPDIAENGAVVPIEVESKIPNTEAIAILIEKNPNAMAAYVQFTPDSLPRLKTRVKMGQTSDVVAVVKAGGKYYMAKKEVKVTAGGCGG